MKAGVLVAAYTEQICLLDLESQWPERIKNKKDIMIDNDWLAYPRTSWCGWVLRTPGSRFKPRLGHGTEEIRKHGNSIFLLLFSTVQVIYRVLDFIPRQDRWSYDYFTL